MIRIGFWGVRCSVVLQRLYRNQIGSCSGFYIPYKDRLRGFGAQGS